MKINADQCRSMLSSVAATTHWQIENNGWEAVFGKLSGEANTEDQRTDALKAAAVHVSNPTRHWLCR